MTHSPYQEEPEEFAFGQATEKLRDSLAPRPEALVKLLQAIPEKTVTKSVSKRLFKEEAPNQLTWLSMFQNTWPKYAFALVAILAVVGITFGLGGSRDNESDTSVVGTVSKTTSSPTTPSTGNSPIPELPKDASIDTIIADVTTISEDDFAEEDSVSQNSTAEDDARLISLYESYDEDTF